MTREKIISQLTDLIRDRESFLNGDYDHDRVFRKDIKALKTAIKVLKGTEIIRCKDCTWYITQRMNKDGSEPKNARPTWCDLWRSEMNPKDYCSRAERKEV